MSWMDQYILSRNPYFYVHARCSCPCPRFRINVHFFIFTGILIYVFTSSGWRSTVKYSKCNRKMATTAITTCQYRRISPFTIGIWKVWHYLVSCYTESYTLHLWKMDRATYSTNKIVEKNKECQRRLRETDSDRSGRFGKQRKNKIDKCFCVLLKNFKGPLKVKDKLNPILTVQRLMS
jgi:hypothetical protein